MISPDIQAEQRPLTFETPATLQSDTNGADIISPSFLKWASLFLLAYFGMRLVFFALNISPLVPPDEVTHAGLCKVFSKVFLLPANSPETYEFGLVTNIPWLYYWIMGKLLHLNFFGISDLVFLRLLNIPLAFATVFFIVRTLRLLTDDRLTQLLSIVALTNTAMFSFLSASVSYDNLTNLLAAMSVYFLMSFFKYRSGGLLAASLLCQLAGCLTKITFLPLVLALNLLLIICEWRNFTSFPAAVRQYFRKSKLHALLTAILLLAATGSNLQLYGGNYLSYGTLNPSMETVVSPEAAMEYRLDARGMIFNRYKEGKITYMDALMLAGEIKNPGDKSDTFFLLMNYENLKRNPNLWLGPLSYSWVWMENIVASIFGIKSHLIMVKDLPYRIPVYMLMSLALVGFLVRWRPRESGWMPLGLAVIAIFYAGFIMYEFNYGTYLTYGAPGLTLYGRYLFPVLAPFSVLFCHYLLRLFRSDGIRLALAAATALLFISYDFPWFLMHATPEWYSWLPV